MKRAIGITAFVIRFASISFLLSAQTSSPTITPGENLVVEGVTPIPVAVADEVGRYTEFRTATLASWHPVRREMLIITRFADTPQLHLVKMPGGDRKQMTFFPDRVAGGLFRPKTGDQFIF